MSPDDERIRRAREALKAAKADARARGDWTFPSDRNVSDDHAEREHGAATRRPRQPRLDDPQPLGAAIGGLLADRGWQRDAALGSVFSRWTQIVGPDLAGHTRPDSFTDGELLVIADSTAWATQVRLLAATLVRRLNAELGDGTVQRVKVRGPAPPPRRGAWRVRGGRGPRDTYG